MNSHQRRKVERAWKYKIDLGDPSYDNYVDAITWCEKNIGTIGYNWSNIRDYGTFYFTKPKYATAFALRWA
jgi:hypothetical protein